MRTFVWIMIGFLLPLIVFDPKALVFFIIGVAASYIIGLLIDIFL
jgi:hypothetical protein